MPYGPRDGRPPLPSGPFICIVCGIEFERMRPKTPPKTCSQACATVLMRRVREQITEQSCAGGCGKVVATSGSIALCDACREVRKREQTRQKNHRRRMVLYSVPSEPYTLAEIAERDRFRCQLCRRKVDMALRTPHPFSPTIDHLVPLSRGGDDTRANVQLAHRQCNTRKGARGMQQLTLVG